jgi:hypothetical protein
MNKLSLTIAMAFTLALGACGGGGGSETLPITPPAAGEVPDAASASVQAMGDYLVDMTATGSDTTEPLALTRFAPKVSDDGEPRLLR